MPVRSFGIPALVAGALALPALAPAPTTTKYKILTNSTQEVDLTALGGPKQTNVTILATYVTIALADSAGGHTLAATIDSIVPDTATRAQFPAAITDSVKGASFRGWMSAKGVVNKLDVVKGGGPLAAQIAQQLEDFYPRVQPGAKAGDTWSDSTDRKRDIGGGSVTVRTKTNYKAAGKEAKDGVQALKVDAAYSSSQAGTLQTPGGPGTLEGTATGKASYWIGDTGAYLGSQREEKGALTVGMPQAPQPIPLTLTTTTTISVLK